MFLIILPYIVTAAAIVGTVANAFKKRWCFGVWCVTNAFWLVYSFCRNEYALALSYALNLIIAVVGLINWSDKPAAPKKITRSAYDVRLGKCPRCGTSVISTAGADRSDRVFYCHGCGQKLRFPKFSAAEIDGTKTITVEELLAQTERKMKK